MTKRRLLALVGAALTLASATLMLVGTSPAGATDWPTKPIRLVVPSAAGGAADLIGRTFGNALTPSLGQQFVIDNRPGAGGALALEAVLRAEPDGYTLLVSGLPYHVLAPALNASHSFDPIRDFTHIAYFGGPPMVLVAHPSLGVKTYKELAARAAADKSGLDYVSPGVGTVGHVAIERLVALSKINLTHVPYRGGGNAIIDLVAGHVKAGCLTWSTLIEHLRAGRLIPLAFTTTERMPEFPDVPTFVELGYPDIVMTAWFSLSGPARMPSPVVERLNQLVNEAITKPEVRKALDRDASLVKPMSSAELTALMQSETDKWAPVVRRLAPGK
jgi:tripartite-type tricarboxylate transporter receptor subunit TctC